MLKKKNPIIAGVLGLLFGPFGYIYINWRYFLMSLVVFTIFTLIFIFLGLDIALLPPGLGRFFVRLPLILIFGWKAYTICSVRNALIDAKDSEVNLLNSFPVVTMAMTDLLVGIGKFYSGAICIYGSVRIFLGGSLLIGFLCLIGTPLVMYVAGVLFGLIGMGIDTLVAFLFTKRATRNFFRNRHNL